MYSRVADEGVSDCEVSRRSYALGMPTLAAVILELSAVDPRTLRSYPNATWLSSNADLLFTGAGRIPQSCQCLITPFYCRLTSNAAEKHGVRGVMQRFSDSLPCGAEVDPTPRLSLRGRCNGPKFIQGLAHMTEMRQQVPREQ